MKKAISVLLILTMLLLLAACGKDGKVGVPAPGKLQGVASEPAPYPQDSVDQKPAKPKIDFHHCEIVCPQTVLRSDSGELEITGSRCTYYLKDGDLHYFVILKCRNNSSGPIHLREMLCHIEDNSKTRLDSCQCRPLPSVLPAGETGYFYNYTALGSGSLIENGSDANGFVPVLDDVRFNNDFSTAETDALCTAQISLEQADGYLHFTGTATNTCTEEGHGYISLQYVIYNHANEVIYIGDWMNPAKPGETVPIGFSGSSPSGVIVMNQEIAMADVGSWAVYSESTRVAGQ